ncbi:unnamed protein product [Acanthoscelides obtectus]|uniref:Uncharacterized protein n=1 Tax=Acanthoscelides obtectus TaxID=200917 RepID=A0A9P0KMN2_ACAOB|nr:unnamed protein product [Acanthoscelides obtectus]CAK1642736.1 hypothetical protein AOBTE_LOCUS13189 [Acanthoscelides obtectus]
MGDWSRAGVCIKPVAPGSNVSCRQLFARVTLFSFVSTANATVSPGVYCRFRFPIVFICQRKLENMATYAAYRHIELDKVGYSKKR